MTHPRTFLRSAVVVVGAAVWLTGTVTVRGGQQIAAPYGQVQGQSSKYDQAIAEARKLLAGFMAEKGVPGLSVAVGVRGDIVWSEGMGLADVEQRVLVSPQTRFRSGSVSKAITSTAAAVLYEQGKLDYDAPIQKYVPSFPDKRHKITPRMLAGHLGGIRYYVENNSDEFYNAKRYRDVLESLEIFARDPLAHEPGTRYLYTTYGTNLLGAAIQGAAGKPFPVVLQELIFDPLKMRSTSVDEFDAIIPDRTRYYERDNAAPSYFFKQSSWGDGKTLGRLLNAPFTDNSNKWAGGGMLTTPEDLVRYGTAHLRPGYLKAETIRMHFTPMKTSDGKSTNYAMNWDIRTDAQGRTIWSKGGSSVGGKSILLMFPDTQVVVAIQHNLTNPNYGQLPNGIAELFLQGAGASTGR